MHHQMVLIMRSAMSNHNATSIMLNDQFMVQKADIDDLPKILAIYNQSIAGKQATANWELVTVTERTAWFNEHLNNPMRPIYVVKAINKECQTTDQVFVQNQATAEIVAWGSFSDLYARPAYHISSEISIYLHQDYHGKGLGNLLTRWMLTQAANLDIHNVVALIFAHNQPSLGLFTKLGFEQWGYMPQVCDMQGFTADVVMLGKTVAIDNQNAL
ncbi:phosphinothricin acetyltransferase [Psychrobacter urativorans]|uniref:Phosphinothricin acetyltransferase n=2 Tax=Psychrobacter urativorans TaxID=45610 RepID=A0A0M4U451_9GAMM|nr:phosphinothricin acetyltransferase [Psychrobacter urativorans]